MQLLSDFRTAAGSAGWSAIDDAVMGGHSASRLVHHADGHATFCGSVSLANGCGFASVRSGPCTAPAPEAQGIALEVRGDGHPYKLNLRSSLAFDAIQYQARFTGPADHWVTLHLARTDFQPTFRGRVLAAAPLELHLVCQIGLVTADRIPGPFRLDVRWIGVT